MQNSIFGEMVFKIGWKKKIGYSFFDENREITLKVKAFREEDRITEEQEMAYKKYLENEKNIVNTINELLTEYSEKAKEQFVPKTLLIGRKGECALLCDDKHNLDDGIAVTIYPEFSILAQDDYL